MDTKPPFWLDQYRVAATHVDLERDIVGLEPQREAIRSILARLRHPTQLAQIGGRLPSGIVLHGPAGTGKTLCARAIASALEPEGVVMYALPGGVLTKGRWAELGAWIGSRNDPGWLIFYIDEIESLGRESPLTGQRSEALVAALSVIDGFEARGRERVLWIAASNSEPEFLSAALVRPGRLELWIGFERPNREERAALFAHYLRDTPHGALDWRRLARLTGDASSAKIVQLVHEAIAYALAEDSAHPSVEWRHLEAAVRADGRVRRRP